MQFSNVNYSHFFCTLRIMIGHVTWQNQQRLGSVGFVKKVPFGLFLTAWQNINHHPLSQKEKLRHSAEHLILCFYRRKHFFYFDRNDSCENDNVGSHNIFCTNYPFKPYAFLKCNLQSHFLKLDWSCDEREPIALSLFDVPSGMM